jgi:hypothetical protein
MHTVLTLTEFTIEIEIEIVMVLRLIHTSTLRLETFIGTRIPDYAILSHTWTAGHEISYQEMTSISLNPSHPASQEPGY